MFSWGIVQISAHVGAKRLRQQTISLLLSGNLDSEVAEFLDGVNAIRSPASFSEVVETRSDVNGDGNYDSWTVTLHPGKSSDMTLLIEDRSSDGKPDGFGFSAAEYQAAIGARTDNSGSDPEGQYFEIGDQRPGGTQKWRYNDLDMDGDIDFMKSLTSQECRLPIDNTWYPVLIDRGGSFLEGLWIYMSSDKIVRARFNRDKGIWEIEEESALTQ